jgi:predicted negative regulator of RcsB-dependent stress response
MAYDLQEQEQLDALKAWWHRYGKILTLIVVVVALVVVGVKAWQHYQQRQILAAATLYNSVNELQQKHDYQALPAAASKVMTTFPNSVYAIRAALLAGKAHMELGKPAEAEKVLQWAVSQAKEPLLRDMARHRLATVLLDQKQYDRALAQLTGDVVPALKPGFSELRGDIQWIAGNASRAHESYREAAKLMGDKVPPLLQIKLDSTGAKV